MPGDNRRPSTICSTDPVKQQDIAELRSLGAEFLPEDLVEGSAGDLSALFKEIR
jgi:hypothetical protein